MLSTCYLTGLLQSSSPSWAVPRLLTYRIRTLTTINQAIRFGTALGLHLKVTDPSVGEAGRLRRARVWYSLYSLEVLIAEVIGRPKSISLFDVTIPVSIVENELKEPSQFLSATDGSISTADSNRIWVNFLAVGPAKFQGITRGPLPRKTFAATGQETPQTYFP